LYFNYKQEVSNFYITAALPDYSRNYWPKHVATTVTNK